MRALALVASLAGSAVACTFHPPEPASSSPDARSGPVIDAECVTFSSQLDTCALPPGYPIDLSGSLRFDTDSGILIDTQTSSQVPVASMLVGTLGGELRAIVATTAILRPDTRLRVEGTRGFAIIARAELSLQTRAIIDASKGGAGARGAAVCPGGGRKGEDNGGGAAGGGGGGLGGAGGKGGNGNSDGIGGQSDGGRGGAAADPVPQGPIGGCAGGYGGNRNAENVGGPGGPGGGAVYLASAIGIAIGENGGVNAGGGGGGGGGFVNGNGDAGGGGGGSGGSIFLEAPRVNSVGILSANGGAGGEASGDGNAGMPGADAPFGVMAATGGTGGSPTGVDGGAGGWRDSAAGASVTQVQPGGGGGGGGGVGIIRVLSVMPSLGELVSPSPAP